MNDLEYWIWFSRINISNSIKIKLIEKFELPHNLYFLKERELISFGLTNKEVSEILNCKYKKGIDKILEYMKIKNIKLINYKSLKYPTQLKNIYMPPIFLYCIGDENLLNKPAISVVGARDASKYGEYVAYKIGGELSKKYVIVSGLAKGIDKFAHEGCLKACGKTIAVLGCGVDFIYPIENNILYSDIIKNGGLVISEYFIGTRPNQSYFPERNRIISGLSEATIVVEAKEKSGSLITAQFALEQGKDVYAVPRKYY